MDEDIMTDPAITAKVWEMLDAEEEKADTTAIRCPHGGLWSECPDCP